MSNKKKSFLLHIDSLEILNDLSDDQAGKLFKAIYSHQIDGEISLDQITKMVFLPFRNQFERDNEKYVKTCERRAIAGSKGGKQKVANASKCKQELANVADSNNNNKNKTKNKSDNNNKEIVTSEVAKAPIKRFVAPSVDEVYKYCNERCNTIDAQAFVDHYIANGWMRGKTKVKDWKACVRTWEKNSKPTQQGAKQYSDVTAQNIKNLEGGW